MCIRDRTLRDYIQGKILETYRSAGFERISTPMLEDMENLDKSEGGDNLNLVFVRCLRFVLVKYRYDIY